MSIAALRELLDDLPEYRRLRTALLNGRHRAEAFMLRSAVPFVLAALRQHLAAPALVVAPRPEDARRLHEQLAAWHSSDAGLLHFPESEILPFERLDSDAETLHRRLQTLAALVNYENDASPAQDALIVVASVPALMQRTIAKSAFTAGSHTLRRNQHLDLTDTLDLWHRLGYRFEAAVHGPGFVSRRGGILDIFPIGADNPVRIELWGSEIDSIRLFDPTTQRSAETIDAVYIPPAQEILPTFASFDDLERLTHSIDPENCTPEAQQRIQDELDLLAEGQDVEERGFYAGFFNRAGLLDYFSSEQDAEADTGKPLLIAYNPPEIADAAWEIQERAHQLRRTKEQRGELPRNFPSSYISLNEIENQLARFSHRFDVQTSAPQVPPWEDEYGLAAAGSPTFAGSSTTNSARSQNAVETGSPRRRRYEPIAMPFQPSSMYYGNIERFVEDIWELSEADGATVVAVTNHSRRLSEIIGDADLSALLATDADAISATGRITLVQSAAGGLSEGFMLPLGERKLAIFTDREIFGVAKQRRTRRRSVTAVRDAFLSELSPGDYVVHVEHGIGRFTGTVRGIKGEDDQDDREYLRIEYAADDKLYVPLEHLDRVTPYVAPMERPPSLTRLGTQEWRRAKHRAEQSTRDMAAELLSLYAARELATGHSFVPDARWQSELEESFPFEETPDQSATLSDVKADMESPKPMDRLVCGDVGYGKTEIALRAAFKAVMDGKQVAMLVPTTVLAQQHYTTFSQRLSAFPTRVEVLSRFRTPQEQRSVVKRIAEGKVDICIGTHRLIQNDVQFKELGLVIVDEEQRFGVAHKERLKQMRSEVDVLTLSATPIPRSLHMALAGVRDMSTIETPPEERLPIKTYVSEISDALVREAILREIDRQGQVYFLHNRVYNIEQMARYVERLVPEARVGIAHGQMQEGELEDVMLEFAEGNLDVLVCTTIIESGLDIPRVNTLLVNRADTLGLSQLYQLRGRVGRSARRAYCYLMTPQSASLTEAAEKRLRAMLDANELGAGFRIAMKDLEIRGAGNILGSEQSGNIQAVGFDLYTRLLSNAVEELRSHSAQNGAAPADNTAGSARDSSQSATIEPPPMPAVEIGIPASIPEDYITDLPMRLGIYQRIVMLKDAAEVEDIEDELRDRFGPLPWQAANLLYIARLKLQAKTAGVRSITRERTQVVLRYGTNIGGARRPLQRILGRRVQIGNTQIRLPMDFLERDRNAPDWETALAATIDRLADFTRRTLAAVPSASSIAPSKMPVP